MSVSANTKIENGKLAAARLAVGRVETGMRLGLGTGSTANIMIEALAARVREEGLLLTCVATSLRTYDLAASLGLSVKPLDEVGWLDLTIDGADEFDPALNLIKGGGGALLIEKIVATASDQMIVIADDTKQVARLGAYPLPVEVVRFGWETTCAIIEDMLSEADVGGDKIELRMAGSEPFVTDEGHYILDLHLGRIAAPRVLALMLNQIPGVVESGLFVDIADLVMLGQADGTAKEVMSVDA